MSRQGSDYVRVEEHYSPTAGDVESAGGRGGPKTFEISPLKGAGGGDPGSTEIEPGVGHAHSVTFEDVGYTLSKWSCTGRRQLRLLKGVTGYARPGQMLALMGPSGCGKTTLLDVLAGRKTQGCIDGSILVGGQLPSRIFLRRHAGYVEQQDTLLGTLTVQEMLSYTAHLKLPMSVSRSEKRRRVEELIDRLGLMPCKHTRIGSQMQRGISGGQARRVSLGISLITNPLILFLDEPTSGLDARTSDQIIATVRKLARQQVAVISTIHTPTTYCFAQFDRLMLMAQGRVVYFGACGPPALTYFAGMDLIPREGDSPAEGVIDLVTSIQEDGGVDMLANKFERSKVAEENAATIKALLAEAPAGGVGDLGTSGDSRAGRATVTPGWYAALVFLRYRTVRNYVSFGFLGPRVLPSLLFTTLMAFLYQGQGAANSVMSLVNVTSLNFMWVVVPAFAAGAYTPTISLERTLFYRERNDGMFRTSTYLACKMVEELTIMALYSVGVAALVFYIVQLKGSFPLFWLVFLTANAISVAFAYLVAAAAPNLDVANAVVPGFMMLMLFFAGFLIMISALPSFLVWVPYVDFIKYGFAALQYNHWNSVTEPIVDMDKLQVSIANATANFMSGLPQRLGIPVIGDEPGTPPPEDGINGFFKNQWESMKDALTGKVKDITHDVTQEMAEKLLGISFNTTINALNETLINVTENAMAAVRGTVGRVNLEINDIRDLSWGDVILSVVDLGPPYGTWANWIVQALFFLVFVFGAWLSMAFVQHQHR